MTNLVKDLRGKLVELRKEMMMEMVEVKGTDPLGAEINVDTFLFGC